MRYALPLLFVVLSAVAGEQTLADYTVEFARENKLEIIRKGEVTVKYHKSPESMAKDMDLPLEYAEGIAVARVELSTGVIHLSRDGEKGRADFYYEVAKYRFWPAAWWREEKKWRDVAEKFMRGWLDRSRAK